MTEKNQNTEKSILDAAKRVFIKKGLQGARMQEIADEASINKSLLHYYYRSKEKLFNAVFQAAFKFMFPKFTKEFMRVDVSLFDKIRFFFKNHIEFLKQNPHLPQFILHEISQNPQRLADLISNRAESLIAVVQQQIENEHAKGIIRYIDAKQLVINMLSLSVFQFAARPLISIVMQFSEDDFDNLLEKRKTELADFVINSLKI